LPLRRVLGHGLTLISLPRESSAYLLKLTQLLLTNNRQICNRTRRDFDLSSRQMNDSALQRRLAGGNCFAEV